MKGESRNVSGDNMLVESSRQHIMGAYLKGGNEGRIDGSWGVLQKIWNGDLCLRGPVSEGRTCV